MDWRYPPAGLCVPVVLAADVVYDQVMAAPVAGLIRRVLAPGGECLLADGDRSPAAAFRAALGAAGLVYATEPLRGELPDGRKASGTLYRIRQGVRDVLQRHSRTSKT
jgi:predicted nicotinamide N-methyase